MTNEGVSLGSIVMATAGRDAGQLFVVIGTVNKDYVLIANGKNRSQKKPKLKKIKHLKFLDFIDENIENLVTIKRLQDADIRKSLKSYNG